MTMTQKIIAIAVTIIIISTVALPVIQDMQNAQIVEEMQSGELYSVKHTNEKVTLGYDSTYGPTLNGVALSSIYTGQTKETTRYYVICDSVVGFAFYTLSTQSWSYWAIKSTSSLTNVSINNASYSAVFESGTVTITASSTYTSSYDYLVIPDTTGNYGIWDYSDRPWHVDSDSTIYAALNTTARSYLIAGKISDLKVEFEISSGSLVTGSTASASYVPTDDGKSNVLSGITLNSGGSSASIVDYAVVVCPLSYHTISDDRMYDLIGIIPIFLILVPVMLAVRMITLRRN